MARKLEKQKQKEKKRLRRELRREKESINALEYKERAINLKRRFMAEKRAKSRITLMCTGFYELGVFGEDESESFKRNG